MRNTAIEEIIDCCTEQDIKLFDFSNKKGTTANSITELEGLQVEERQIKEEIKSLELALIRVQSKIKVLKHKKEKY